MIHFIKQIPHSGRTERLQPLRDFNSFLVELQTVNNNVFRVYTERIW